jgi:hypothetical protein
MGRFCCVIFLLLNNWFFDHDHFQKKKVKWNFSFYFLLQ